MTENYIREIRIDWDKVKPDSYIKSINALSNLESFIFEKPITFFVGENGTGKSTLLEAIAENYGFNKEGGTKNYNFSTFNENSDLKDALTIVKGYRKPKSNYFFRAETFFNVATMEMDYLQDKSQEYHYKSHGESFLNLFTKLANTGGIFLLDEPEAALSPQRQLSLFSLIYEASKNGSQFIIVTHSPILLGIPDAFIYEFSDNGINKIQYEDTDSYKITSYFINHKDSMVKELTKDLD